MTKKISEKREAAGCAGQKTLDSKRLSQREWEVA